MIIMRGRVFYTVLLLVRRVSCRCICATRTKLSTNSQNILHTLIHHKDTDTLRTHADNLSTTILRVRMRSRAPKAMASASQTVTHWFMRMRCWNVICATDEESNAPIKQANSAHMRSHKVFALGSYIGRTKITEQPATQYHAACD